jgi:hypothetical protein
MNDLRRPSARALAKVWPRVQDQDLSAAAGERAGRGQADDAGADDDGVGGDGGGG